MTLTVCASCCWSRSGWKPGRRMLSRGACACSRWIGSGTTAAGEVFILCWIHAQHYTTNVTTSTPPITPTFNISIRQQYDGYTVHYSLNSSLRYVWSTETGRSCFLCPRGAPKPFLLFCRRDNEGPQPLRRLDGSIRRQDILLICLLGSATSSPSWGGAPIAPKQTESRNVLVYPHRLTSIFSIITCWVDAHGLDLAEKHA